MSPQEYTLQLAQTLEGQILQHNYRIDRLVGKGGMAWVYQAFHQNLKQALAIKILQPDLVSDVEIRERFLSEGRVQFRMRHPHIVEVTDLIEDGEWIGIVMEWVEGENLKQLLKRQNAPLSRRDIWRVMAPILDAVGFAHEQGLVHRDIKPANILLKQKAEGEVIPKIADFGIAKILDDADKELTSTGMTMGTLKYMAPEQIRDSKSVDHRADIYSLGVTLYMMSTLQPPFRGQQDYIIYQQLHEEPPAPSSWNPVLSPEFDSVVLRCLAKNPEDRFASCQEFLHALSLSLLTQEELPSPPTQLGIFQLNQLIDNLSESSSLYNSSVRPVNDSILQPLARGPHTSPYVEGAGTDGKDLSPMALEPTLDNTPPQRWKETPHGQSGNFHPSLTKGASSEHDQSVSLPSGSEASSSQLEASQSGYTRKAFPTSSPLWWGVGVLVLLLGVGIWWKQTQRNPTKTPQLRENNSQSQARHSKPVSRRIGGGSECQGSEERPCYTGPAAVRGKGVCKVGVQHCLKGKFGPCKGQVLPVKQERCNGLDDDCDGKVDNAVPKVGRACDGRMFDCSIKGSWRCNPKLGKLVCKGRRQPKSGMIRILPTTVSFGLQYRRRRRRARGLSCLALEGATMVRLKRAGYYTCLFKIRKSSKVTVIRMRRKKTRELAPLENYCLRR